MLEHDSTRLLEAQGASFLLLPLRPKLYHTLNFYCWFLTASGFEVLALVLMRLEEESADVLMEALDVGAETKRAEAQ